MNPNTAHRLATASLTNALEFEAQANFCFDRRWFGRACSLAILGQEEAGKAMYFFQVAIGALRFKPDAVKVLFRRHVPKQQLGQAPVFGESLAGWSVMAAALHTSMGRFVDADESKLESATPDEIEAMLRQSLDDFEHALGSDSPGEAQFVEGIRNTVFALRELDLDGLKQSGFYVDYDEKTGVVSTPEKIDSATATAQLECLREIVAVLTTMLNAVPAGAVDRLRELLLPLLAEAAARGKAANTMSLKPEGERPPPG